MTYEQITSLLDRGFTPEQITMLTTTAVSPAAVAHPAPDAAEEESAAVPPVDTASAPEDDNSTSADVLAAIADLKKTVQAQNIRTMMVDTVAPEAELEKAMSELIRPSYRKE